MFSLLRQYYQRHFVIKPDPRHYLALDGWRGICAVMVALFHFRAFSHISDWAFIKSGGLFLDFFFVLSGFVIFANYYDRLKSGFPIGKFMWLRIGRLYPLHVVTLFAFLLSDLLQLLLPFLAKGALYTPFAGPYEGPRYIIANLFMLHSTGVTDNLSYNSPSWSISAEFYTYLIYALLIALSRGKSIVIYLVTFFMFVHMYLVPEHMTGTANLGILRCIYGFGLGGVVWFLFERIKSRFTSLSAFKFSLMEITVFIGAFFYVQLVYHSGGPGLFHVFSPFVFSLAVFLFAFQKGLVSRILMNKFFALLGILSYSIYMTHILVGGKIFYGAGRVVEKMAGIKIYTIKNGIELIGTNLWAGDAIYLLYISLVIGFSCLTYLLIEVPGRDWFRRKVGKTA